MTQLLQEAATAGNKGLQVIFSIENLACNAIRIIFDIGIPMIDVRNGNFPLAAGFKNGKTTFPSGVLSINGQGILNSQECARDLYACMRAREGKRKTGGAREGGRRRAEEPIDFSCW